MHVLLEKILREIWDFKKQKFDMVNPMSTDKIGIWCCDKISEIIRPCMKDDGWIPVNSGKLPDEGENPITRDFYEYEVTFQSDNVCDIRHYKYGRGHWWHGGTIVDEYVTAWRPKPKPYQLKERKNDEI